MDSRWCPSMCWAYSTVILVNIVLARPPIEKGAEAWDPNYCNDTKLQESSALTKTALGQFLGYQCDTVFFHCRWGVDGWRTYKKTCRKGLVYDTTGTQNCNYDFNVDGCGMKQCADCLGDQYACCLSEECVDLGMRCDGKYDCTLEEDEQNCPTCDAGEFPCVLSEQCVTFDKRCNGNKDCKDGTDEHQCDGCPAGNFYCLNSKICIESKLRCDGKRDCNLGEDEAFCSSIGDDQKEYTCEDQVHVVPKQDVCNGVDDCPDGTDELYCNSATMEEDSQGDPHLPILKSSNNITKSNGTLTGAAPPSGNDEVEDEEEENETDTSPELEDDQLTTGHYQTSASTYKTIPTSKPVFFNTTIPTTPQITTKRGAPVRLYSSTTKRPPTVILTSPPVQNEEYFYDETQAGT